jgi:hypothetical protein
VSREIHGVLRESSLFSRCCPVHANIRANTLDGGELFANLKEKGAGHIDCGRSVAMNFALCKEGFQLPACHEFLMRAGAAAGECTSDRAGAHAVLKGFSAEVGGKKTGNE